jgi:hypothetical protein
VTLDTLKHRDVAQIDGMLERLVRLVTRFAFAIREAAEIDWMLERAFLGNRRNLSRVRQDCVTDVAVVANHFAGVTHVFAVVTTKTT